MKDLRYWKEFATKAGLNFKYYSGGQGMGSNLYHDFNGLGKLKYSRFALSTNDHSVVLRSVTQHTIIKINGNVTFKYFFNVMDPSTGGNNTFNASSIKNIIGLFK